MSPTTSSLLSSLLLLLTSIFSLAGNANAQESSASLHLIADAIDWPVAASAFSSSFASDRDDDLIRDPDEVGNQRRSLFWRRRNLADHYISYGALSANRVPCPPRSGRSYYTHSCHRARGPVYPYSRGCNSITLCRRERRFMKIERGNDVVDGFWLLILRPDFGRCIWLGPTVHVVHYHLHPDRPEFEHNISSMLRSQL